MRPSPPHAGSAFSVCSASVRETCAMSVMARRSRRPTAYVPETRRQRITSWTGIVLAMAATAGIFGLSGAQSSEDPSGVVPGKQVAAVIVRQLHLGPLVELIEHGPARELPLAPAPTH